MTDPIRFFFIDFLFPLGFLILGFLCVNVDDVYISVNLTVFKSTKILFPFCNLDFKKLKYKTVFSSHIISNTTYESSLNSILPQKLHADWGWDSERACQ